MSIKFSPRSHLQLLFPHLLWLLLQLISRFLLFSSRTSLEDNSVGRGTGIDLDNNGGLPGHRVGTAVS